MKAIALERIVERERQTFLAAQVEAFLNTFDTALAEFAPLMRAA